MASIPSWAGLALVAAMFAGAVALIFALTRMAVHSANRRREAVARLLANPQLLQRVWYVQREYNTHHEVLLRGRDQNGQEVTLAFPAEAPHVWHQLQLAGVLVHAEP
jgi:cystathionine beta-lyase/cystathionine gamma-synthase